MPVTTRRLLVAIAAVVVGLAVVLLGGAAPAAAHATLQDTQPAADALLDAGPDAVVLTFDEPVSAATGAVQVISPSGARVDGGVDELDGGRAVSIDVDADQRGTYTVAYRVVSDDGHTITGSFVFHVGARTGAADIDQSIPVATSGAGGVGRWLGYAGAAVSVGAALLLFLLRRPTATRPTGAVTGRLGTLVVGGAAASALGTTVAVVAQTATTTGRSLGGALSLVAEVAGDSRPVAVALLRAAILVGATIVGAAGRARRLPAALVTTGAVVAVAGLLAPVAGHPWTADPRSLAVPVDALHLLAASVWLGLLVALVAASPVLADPDRAVGLVSTAALVAAGVVAVTGVTSGWLLLGSVDALVRTSSGQLVLLKAVGFALLVALGWINRTRLVPLLTRLTHPPTADDLTPDHGTPPDDSTTRPDDGTMPEDPDVGGYRGVPRLAGPARRRLLQLVRAEIVVGALVLAVTAGLVNQPPGRDTLARPYAAVRADGELRMRLEVEPARAGDNTLHVYLTDTDGQPVRFDALEVTVARDGVPERTLDGVTPISPDHASVYGASLPTPGTWTIVVTTVTLSTTAQFTYEVPVR